jgi:hypothetical protein
MDSAAIKILEDDTRPIEQLNKLFNPTFDAFSRFRFRGRPLRTMRKPELIEELKTEAEAKRARRRARNLRIVA